MAKDPYRVIQLTKGFVAIISSEDYRRVMKHKWRVTNSAGTKRRVGQPYARGIVNGKDTYLHRFIMGCDNPKLHVDHRNHCTLDCRQENLEVTDHITNMQRRRKKNSQAKARMKAGKE